MFYGFVLIGMVYIYRFHIAWNGVILNCNSNVII